MRGRLAALEARVAELESREVHLRLDGPTVVEQLLKIRRRGIGPELVLNGEYPRLKDRERADHLTDQFAVQNVAAVEGTR